MSKPTPGPWTVYDAPGAGLQIRATAGAIAKYVPFCAEPAFKSETDVMTYTLRMQHSQQQIALADERWIQFEPSGWHEMQEANARLMGAAPELLKACDAAFHALRSYQYGNAATDLAKEIADFCESAIAKAAGNDK